MEDEEQTLVVTPPVELPEPGAGSSRDRPRLLVLSGEDVGKTHHVEHGAILGRGSGAEIRLPFEDVSREHARLVFEGAEILIEDLGSTNGTRLNGAPIFGRARLANGDKIHVGTTALRFAFFDELDESFHDYLYQSASRDPLTSAFNRKHLDARLESECAYSARHGTPLALLLVDVDHFKRINDTWGHLAGDGVLIDLTQHLEHTVRSEDVLARYGGEEFAILSRGIDLEGAVAFAERLRSSVERTHFSHRSADQPTVPAPSRERPGDTIRLARPTLDTSNRIPLTVSIGVAAVPGSLRAEPRLLVEAADEALYRAKASGRNCVRAHGSIPVGHP